MPSGAKIGGINPGTIVIKGKKESSANLPEQGLTGDGYIVGGDLYVAADNNNPTTWTNVGTIRGPQGPRGYQGFTGFRELEVSQDFRDTLEFKDLLDSRVIPVMVHKDILVIQDSKDIRDSRDLLVEVIRDLLDCKVL